MLQLLVLLTLFTSVFLPTHSLQSAYVIKNGSLMNTKDVAMLPIEEHFRLGKESISQKKWQEAVQQFRIVIINFPEEDLARLSLYLLGVSYFYAGDMDLANQHLNKYLEAYDVPQFFEETYQYKLAIVKSFKEGAKRHIFGSETMPSILSAEDLALELCDEVAAALPHHEIAARALLYKAELLTEEESFRQAVEICEHVIRQFPQTKKAAEAYITIAKIYRVQASHEGQNPDLIALAEINLKKFKHAFAENRHIQAAENALYEMQAIFADALYEMGCFYERKKKPKASVLYYQTTLHRFPDTNAAILSKERLAELRQYVDELYGK